MIRFQSRGARERRLTPVFVCDICEQPIMDLTGGAVVFRNRGVGEDELLELLHVHKGVCDQQAVARISGQGHTPWHELADHLNEIAYGAGATIRGMIEREVSWSVDLSSNDQEELQRRVSDLRDWLCEHGLHSRLWCED